MDAAKLDAEDHQARWQCQANSSEGRSAKTAVSGSHWNAPNAFDGGQERVPCDYEFMVI